MPSFQKPKSRNAATTLAVMGGLAITMFAGITALAVVAKVHMAENPRNLVGLPAGAAQKTALAQLAAAVFGHSVMFYAVQVFTAAILVLAANTAYNGFPVLASILSVDGYLPRQLARRGDRLVSSNGIVILSVLATALIAAFNANVSKLIQSTSSVCSSRSRSASREWSGTGSAIYPTPPTRPLAGPCCARAPSTRPAPSQRPSS